MRRAVVGMVVVASLVAAACSNVEESEPGTTQATTDGPTTPSADTNATTPGTVPGTDPTSSPTQTVSPTEPTAADTEPLPSASFGTRPGPHQITVVGAEPGDELEAVAGDGGVAATGTVDEQGSLLFRDLEPGDYTVNSNVAATGTVTVTSADEVPPERFYEDQDIEAGFGYLKARDGTTLSVNVVLPAGEGPFPTVVEYSGYQPSDPDSFGFGQLFPALGYAYVGVNMRGSGCSGGSWRFFETVQNTDGYDAIEAIAAQPWVKGNKVGMVGVSYPGISQLFVAKTQPPSLAAITPLSVLDDSYQSTLYPGGILNTGFAVEWMTQRLDETQPEGQAWTVKRIEEGDEVCAENQQLRLQNPDLVSEIGENPYYSEELGDPLAPRTFVDQIDVPVFVAGAWQDEQTGGRFPTMLDDFDSSPHLYASLVNGLHTESISTGVVPRFLEFLDLYVAERTPNLDVARGIAPVLGNAIFGTEELAFPQRNRFEGMPYEEALAGFEAEPSIEILFENGAAEGYPARTPNPRFSEGFDAWPIPSVEPTTWYLGDGTLDDDEASEPGAVGYQADPDVLPETFYSGSLSDIWKPSVEWQWRQNPRGTAASFATEPLQDDTTMIGSASADLWITVDEPDTDLEVTLSEIRPDGQEMYVQSGWLRASHRALDEAASSELQPVQTHLEGDAVPLEPGDVTPVRVEIFPFAHVFRAGSRLRITVDAPGNSRAQWILETISNGENVEIVYGPDTPSAIVLPVVPGVDVPAEYPECGALKGQPCRRAPRT